MTCALSKNTVMGAPNGRAVPAGGARKRGRGCLLVTLLSIAAGSLAQAQEQIAVPSGQAVTFLEMISESAQSGALVRFRFVAPTLAQESSDVEMLALDMEHLCQTYALEKLAEIRAEPRQIVISLSAEPTEFGVATPGVRQAFEAFSVQENLCIWEAF